MTNKPVAKTGDIQEKIRERKYYSCKNCGFSMDNRGTWCAKGCGSDYNEMVDVTGVVKYFSTLLSQELAKRDTGLLNLAYLHNTEWATILHKTLTDLAVKQRLEIDKARLKEMDNG